MKPRRRAGLVLGSMLLALCFFLIVLSVIPDSPKEAPKRYVRSNRPLLLESVALPLGDINVNTADLDALNTLPGIGPAIAQAIIDARESGGAFYYPEDLLDVRGIGEKTLDKLRDLIIITEEEP